MSNTVYENKVLESKLTGLVNSKIAVRSLMTVDDSLAEGAGLTKVINRYVYDGSVEELSGGEANTNVGNLTFTPENYTVKRYQQTFRYNDMEVMQDPNMIDVALEGIADVMANQVRSEYFAELVKTKNRHGYSGNAVTYSDIVDALASLGREVEAGLFVVMSAQMRTAIRKDSDFIAARSGEIIYTGQFGTICGVPVLFSSLVPDGMAIITDKDAVRFFVKKEASLEQDRNVETKVNTVVYERCGLIALVDDTSTVLVGKAAPALTATLNGNIFTNVTKHSDSNKIYYQLSSSPALNGQVVSGWTEIAVGGTIPGFQVGQKVAIAEADAEGKCVASCVKTRA